MEPHRHFGDGSTIKPEPDHAKTIFLRAIEGQSPENWEAFLDGACGADARLRLRVSALLQAHQELGSFRDEAPANAMTIDMPAGPHTAVAPGMVIGPYKLLEQIGEGGMGVVYMAQQTAPVRRKVALKVVKPGMDTREVVARFEAERQALALMDHPHIAHVFEAGATAAGRPYFVMELVRGVPITEYCDQNNLPVRERLELFVTVCHAVQHAHQKGIIHRDIKPSNVLVTLHDGTPIPKVIDFGLAKAIGQQLTDKTLFTRFAQMVGTPLYMSPEQAELAGLDIDTRGDIYSLGVLLYELLTGTTPFEGVRMQKAALDEIRRMIREEDPPAPSTRLSSTAGETQTTVAAHRRIDPRGLSRLVRGDLDWIVMKALEKDRARRYETANGFAADVGRYLNDEPVEACPPSSLYRFRKFVRRNRAALAPAGLLGVALLLATSTIGWTIRDRTAQRAETERELAATRRQSTRERLAREAKLEGRIHEALEESRAEYERDRVPAAIAAVKHAERLLASGEVGNDALREGVRSWQAELEVVRQLEDLGCLVSEPEMVLAAATYFEVFRELGINVDELTVDEAGRRVRSHATWQRLTEALDHWSGIKRFVDEHPGSDASLRKKRLLQVARAADPDEFRSQVRLAIENQDLKAADRLAASPEVGTLPAATLDQLARTIFWRGGASGPRRATRLMEHTRIERAGDFQLNVCCANFYAWMNPPRWAEAAHLASIALAIRPGNVRLQSWLGSIYYRQGKLDDAIACYRQSIRLDLTYTVAHDNLGLALESQGKPEQAIACFRRAIELEPKTSSFHANLGRTLATEGKLDEAIACFRTAIELDPSNSSAYKYLGATLNDRGKPDEAIVHLRKALELDSKSAFGQNELGSDLLKQAKVDEAIACFRRAIELDPKFPVAHMNLGFALNKHGKPEQAIACFRTAIRLDLKDARAHVHLAVILNDQGKPDEAILQLRTALELDSNNALAQNRLGVILNEQGKPDEAIVYLRRAIELNPNAASALDHRYLAAALMSRGTFDEALIDYSKALALSPADWGTWDDRGMLYLAQDQPEKAIADFTRSIAIHSEAAWVWHHRSNAYVSSGHWRQALADLSKTDELEPQNDDTQRDLAWLLATCPELKLRDSERAVRLATQATARSPEQGRLWNALGVALFRAGDLQAAIGALEKSMSLRQGGDALDYLVLAMCHSQLKHKDEARSWFGRGATWIDSNRTSLERDRPRREELQRFRVEAEQLLK